MSDTASSRPDAATIAVMVEEARGLAVASTDDPGLPFEPGNVGLLAAVKALDAAAFERIRSMLRNAGVRVPVLDKLITAKLTEGDSEDTGQAGKPLSWPEDEPAANPVNGAALAEHIAAFIRRYVGLPPHGAVIVTLWIMATHTFKAFRVFVRLAITAPLEDCGKSTLLDVVGLFVPRPLQASNISPAAVYRVIDEVRPTVLLDEADTYLHGDNKELIGVLNSGHARNNAFVVRTVGDDHKPHKFSTFAPMAFALIGHLPRTLASRSLHIEMQRLMAGESVENLDEEEVADEVTMLRGQLVRWAADELGELTGWRGDMLPALRNRRRDNWRPLFAIANRLGETWKMRVEFAALAALGTPDASPSANLQLIADVVGIMAAEWTPGQPYKSFALPTAQILTALHILPERDYSTWSKPGKPISDKQLADALRGFQITSGTVRVGAATPKGYKLPRLWSAYLRYALSLAPRGFGVSSRHTGTLIEEAGLWAHFVAATKAECGGSENDEIASNSADCGGVAAQNGKTPSGGAVSPPISALDAWFKDRCADDDLLAAEREETETATASRRERRQGE